MEEHPIHQRYGHAFNGQRPERKSSEPLVSKRNYLS